jgi:hypothetical protein
LHSRAPSTRPGGKARNNPKKKKDFCHHFVKTETGLSWCRIFNKNAPGIGPAEMRAFFIILPGDGPAVVSPVFNIFYLTFSNELLNIVDIRHLFPALLLFLWGTGRIHGPVPKNLTSR